MQESENERCPGRRGARGQPASSLWKDNLTRRICLARNGQVCAVECPPLSGRDLSAASAPHTQRRELQLQLICLSACRPFPAPTATTHYSLSGAQFGLFAVVRRRRPRRQLNFIQPAARLGSRPARVARAIGEPLCLHLQWGYDNRGGRLPQRPRGEETAEYLCVVAGRHEAH